MLLPLVCACALPAQRYLVHSYTEHDGLPSSVVDDVSQAEDGRMWFATRVGAVSYDGTQWTGLQAGADGRRRAVISVSPTGPDELCLLNHDGVVWLHRAGQWRELPQFAANTVATQPFTVRGVDVGGVAGLVVGTHRAGVFLWNGERWLQRLAPDSGHGDVRALAVWQGVLRVATSNGVFTVSPDSVVELWGGSDAAEKGVWGLAADGDRGLWLAGLDWVGLLQPDGGVEHRAASFDFDRLRLQRVAVTADRRGGVYVSARGGTFFVHGLGGRIESLGTQNGLVSGTANALYCDREGSLWFGTDIGVSKLVSRRFASFGRQHGLLRDEVSSAAERSTGQVILGHNGGLTLLHSGRIESLPFSAPGPPRVNAERAMDLAVDADDRVWIAGSQRGFGCLTGDNGLEWFEVAPVPGLEVVGIATDPRGVWLATSRGLWRSEGGVVRPVPAVGDRVVRRVAWRDDVLWAATIEGLYRFSGERCERLLPEDGSPGSLFTVLPADDAVWVGAGDGLWRVDGQVLRRPKARALAIDRPVYSLVVDHRDELWIGTDYGVFRWNGQRLHHETVSTGLAGHETNRGAALCGADGRVWIGTDRGVSVYEASSERTVPPPRVAVQHVRADGEARHGPSIDVGAGTRHLEFALRAVSFVDEHRMQFRTKLVGFDRDWRLSKGRTRLTVDYAGLPPGNYRFVAQARHAWSTWGSPLSGPMLAVQAPIWNRWYGWLVATAGLALVGFGWQRWHYQRRYNKELRREVQARSRELAAHQIELADSERLRSLGVLAGGIVHDFNNVLTALSCNLSLMREKADRAAGVGNEVRACEHAVQRATELAGQLLSFARGGVPVADPARLDRLIGAAADLVFSGAAVRCEVSCPGDLPPVAVDPAQLQRVLENVLLNARQASDPGGRVEVHAATEQSSRGETGQARVVLEVRDHGCGVPAELRERVFESFFSTKSGGSGLGLATARAIVVKHGGRIDVRDADGGGAVFRIDLPVAATDPEGEPELARATGLAGRPTVLVMDDQESIRAAVRPLLEGLGCRVVLAATGEEVVRLLRPPSQLAADCAIFDMTVPGGKGGAEILPVVRELAGDLKIIASSGYSTVPIVGFDAVLAKPYRREDLGRVLRQVLGQAAG